MMPSNATSLPNGGASKEASLLNRGSSKAASLPNCGASKDTSLSNAGPPNRASSPDSSSDSVFGSGARTGSLCSSARSVGSISAFQSLASSRKPSSCWRTSPSPAACDTRAKLWLLEKPSSLATTGMSAGTSESSEISSNSADDSPSNDMDDASPSVRSPDGPSPRFRALSRSSVGRDSSSGFSAPSTDRSPEPNGSAASMPRADRSACSATGRSACSGAGSWATAGCTTAGWGAAGFSVTADFSTAAGLSGKALQRATSRLASSTRRGATCSCSAQRRKKSAPSPINSNRAGVPSLSSASQWFIICSKAQAASPKASRPTMRLEPLSVWKPRRMVVIASRSSGARRTITRFSAMASSTSVASIMKISCSSASSGDSSTLPSSSTPSGSAGSAGAVPATDSAAAGVSAAAAVSIAAVAANTSSATMPAATVAAATVPATVISAATVPCVTGAVSSATPVIRTTGAVAATTSAAAVSPLAPISPAAATARAASAAAASAAEVSGAA